MSTLQRTDGATATVDQIKDVLALYEDPKDPESKRRIATIMALFRASENAANALSWGEAMAPGVRIKLAMFVAKHRFDPAAEHVNVLGGKLYVTLAGRLFKADEHRDDKGAKTFGGFKVDRPMTPEERALYEIPKGALGWYVEVERTDCKYPFVGIGMAGGECERNPVAAGFGRIAIAQKRAREKGLRTAYPIGDPGDEIIVDADGSSTVIEAVVSAAPPAALGSATATEAPTPPPNFDHDPRFDEGGEHHAAANPEPHDSEAATLGLRSLGI
jgi:hypothetical protein